MKQLLTAALTGLLFGIGLDIGGMTNPANILGFLDVAGEWNPRLIFVMGGAIPVTFVGYRLAFRRRHPFWAFDFQLPQTTSLDSKLVGGAALFGIGWGLAGYCPGPVLSSLSQIGSGQAANGLIGFLISMVVGIIAVKTVQRRILMAAHAGLD
ncbi:MAG: YeeE/YedE family protein [Rhodospirillales bacterium]|nr:YeeE/YedE family protein [Rhodospirillales bacterium]